MEAPSRRHGAVATGVALLVVSLAAMAGCGDGDDAGSAGGGASSPDRTRFAKEARSICLRRNAGLRQAVAGRAGEGPGGGRRALVAKLKGVTLPAVAEQVSAIRELDIPLSQYTRVEDMLDSQEEAVAQLEGLSDVASFQIVEVHFAEADRMWTAYGVEDCAVRALG